MSKDPGVIKKLDETVVNRIAAGEVVQRPSSALKELIENCLDAKATQIQITVRQGGLKLLQIQDNGTGIRKDDLNIVCERFTTSKLKDFDDLRSIGTYGFRGEALASISHVAHLNITTRTSGEKCAWKVSYSDGAPKGTPRPSAGNQGTVISVEDLFYNVATRRKALRSPTEEYNRISEVVSRYAVHNALTGFTLRKEGEPSPELRTPATSVPLENIRTIYGASIARELVPLRCQDDRLRFTAEGLVSNANYSAKKFTFLLFINNRLVESTALRRAIEQVYTSYLAKHTHPFVYMSLCIAPENVDVNVHPTKHEVHFLYQDAVADAVQKAVDAAIISSNTSRTFYTQSLLSSAVQSSKGTKDTKETSESCERATRCDRTLVRTDAREQKIDKFLDAKKTHQENSNLEKNDEKSNVNVEDESVETCEKREITYTSVQELRDQIVLSCHSGLREAIANHSFVGCASQRYALLQHTTKLYLTNTVSLCEELFFQLLINDFGNFGIIKLSCEVSIRDLVLVALEDENCGWNPEDGPKEELASYVTSLIASKCDMLEDYFSFKVEPQEQMLKTLPYILDGYVPCMDGLPMYLLRLATEVDWSDEKLCFSSLCRETAKFYAAAPHQNIEDDKDQDDLDDKEKFEWKVEHVLYPAMKKHLKPPQGFAQDSTFVQVANLPDLYKVFERC